VRCSTCDEPAVVDQPYRGSHACRRHFLGSVEARIRAEFHRQLPRFRGGTIAVALSGGKDSAVALTAAHQYFSRRPTVRLVALTVDEGIDGYRSATVVAAQKLTERLGVEHRVVRAEAVLGTTTDRAAQALPGTIPCSFCGVWRRRLLNQSARDVHAERLVLGFNLDDLAQTVLMNLVRGDLDRIGRMAPHRRRQPGMVPRVAPLAQIPEREVFLYAHLTGLPFDHGECPHAGRATRNIFRDVVWQLEEALPGTRQALLRTREQLLDRIPLDGPAESARQCRLCGEASSGEVCRSCSYLGIARLPMVPTVAP
jgi:uncharacterized protein (TIGR00269 family)